MKFFDREKETEMLREIRETSHETAQFTVLTGRRRIGKTTLVLHAYNDIADSLVYLFVSRKAEKDLCKDFKVEITSKLKVPVFGNPESFSELFQFLMDYSKTNPITVFIDEFQDFKYVNSSIFNDMQKIWDLNKADSKINLVVAGSMNTMMNKLFRDSKQPLFQRETGMIKLYPLAPSVLKDIMAYYHPEFTADDLLALYSFTGGVVKYVETFIDNKDFSRDSMIDRMIRDGSIFIEEGNVLLIGELGKEYGTYYSILSAIASGKTTRNEIENAVGREISGYLTRMEYDYELIGKRQPIYSKNTNKNVAYEIRDNFLMFWFRFINKYGFMTQIRAFEKLRTLIKRDYETFSGWMLERYFRDKLQETGDFTRIGGWWDRKGFNEIDIVASDDLEKEVSFFEVKRNVEKYRKEELLAKVNSFLQINSELEQFHRTIGCLSMDDM